MRDGLSRTWLQDLRRLPRGEAQIRGPSWAEKAKQVKPTILLDIDGVTANFVRPVLDAVTALTGKTYTDDDVTEWDMYKALGVSPEVGKAADEVIKTKGFCRSLRLYDGAREGVEELRRFADVYAVTAPFDSDYWMREREQWLVAELGFSRYDIVPTHAKHMVAGDVLIDDKTSTLVKWQEQPHTLGAGILFSQPWNKADAWGGHRAVSWAHLVAIVKYRFGVAVAA